MHIIIYIYIYLRCVCQKYMCALPDSSPVMRFSSLRYWWRPTRIRPRISSVWSQTTTGWTLGRLWKHRNAAVVDLTEGLDGAMICHGFSNGFPWNSWCASDFLVIPWFPHHDFHGKTLEKPVAIHEKSWCSIIFASVSHRPGRAPKGATRYVWSGVASPSSTPQNSQWPSPVRWGTRWLGHQGRTHEFCPFYRGSIIS